MTNAELLELTRELADKSGSDWFPDLEMDRLLNMAQNRYVDMKYKILEQDEMARAQMNPITKKSSPFLTTATINLSTITDFRYVLSASAKINYTDKFGNVTEVENAVQPRALNKFIKNKNNSFTKPTVKFPVYEEYNDGTHILQIFSGGVVPNSVTIFYLRIPTIIDATNNPSANVDFSNDVCEDIAMMCVEQMMGIIESPRFGEVRVEEQERFTNN